MPAKILACDRYWTPEQWAEALWNGDQRRRNLYLSRDYRWATKQRRLEEWEGAWRQREHDAALAFEASQMKAVAA